jgi:hypothetical protein
MDNIDFPSRIELGALEVDFDLDADLQINTTALTDEFSKQAILFARYSTAYELALFETNRIKAELSRFTAHVEHRGRMDASEAGMKYTEKMSETYVNGNKDLHAMTLELLEAQKIAGLLKQARDAMVQKRDMLMQLGATQRQERASDISMKQTYVASNNHD